MTIRNDKFGIEILTSDENFNGRSFGEWTGDWWNRIISSYGYEQNAPVRMLRAGLTTDDKGVPTPNDMHKADETIFEGQALLFPLLNTLIDSKIGRASCRERVL